MVTTRRYRQPSLRQIEVFKAVIEMGTVSRAAQALNMSQPAASKLLSNLEADIGLELFERRRGLLSPTDRGFRFYKEVDRIFAGLNQISQAADSLRREERGQLAIGVMPILSGPFITSVISAFVAENPDVHISLHSRSSQFLSGWMRSGELDVCVVTQRTEDTQVLTEPILSLPIVCVLPVAHPLADSAVLKVADIAGEPFISYNTDSYTRVLLDMLFEREGLQPNVVLNATTSEGVCEMVAAGLGVSLGHPIAAERVKGRVALVPFEPAETMHYLMCRSRHGRNRRLIAAFSDKLREVAEATTQEFVTQLSAR